MHLCKCEVDRHRFPANSHSSKEWQRKCGCSSRGTDLNDACKNCPQGKLPNDILAKAMQCGSSRKGVRVVLSRKRSTVAVLPLVSVPLTIESYLHESQKRGAQPRHVQYVQGGTRHHSTTLWFLIKVVEAPVGAAGCQLSQLRADQAVRQSAQDVGSRLLFKKSA